MDPAFITEYCRKETIILPHGGEILKENDSLYTHYMLCIISQYFIISSLLSDISISNGRGSIYSLS